MTDKRLVPDIKTANWTFLLMTVLLLGGSMLLVPVIGIGINTLINELVWILGLVLLVSRKKGYSYQESFKLKKADGADLFLSALLGFTIWFPAMFINTIIEKVISANIGALDIDIDISFDGSPVQAVLLIISMTVLAPACEELFFRGFMQSAYEKYNRRYSWIIVGILFGLFHIPNGISNLVPATMLGLVMSYLMLLTNSIWPPIVFHAFNNLNAAFLGGISQIIAESDKIPAWFIIVLLSSTIFFIVFLLALKKKYSKNESVDSGFEEEEEKAGQGKFTGMWIAVVILILFGIMEIWARLIGLE